MSKPNYKFLDGINNCNEIIDINELINAVNNKDTVVGKDEFTGKEGDIRVVKSNDGSSYEIQGRTSEGWAKTSLTLNTE